MFWIAMLVASGVIYLIVNRMGLLLVAIAAVTVLLYFITLAAVWVNDSLGFQHFIVGSWQFLSGVDSPTEIMSTSCVDYRSETIGIDLWRLVLALVVLIIAVLNGIPILAGIIGVALGSIVSVLGAIATLVYREKAFLVLGLAILFFGVAGVVVSGLAMRLMIGISSIKPC
jgi:hypothetical protein